MTTVYAESPYCSTIYVSGQKTALSADRLATFASFTNGGTIPFYIRWQYSAKYVITSGTPSNPTYGGFGPLDETVDKLMGTPGLRLILNLAYFPTNWLAIDATGKNVGYGNGLFPDGPAMATFAAAVTTRYQSYVNSGRIILQIFNEEMDTGLNGAIGGTILAPIFNYAVPAITAIAPNAIVIAGAVRNLKTGGSHIQQWMTNLFTYVPKGGEPAQSLPYAVDLHAYFNGSSITSNGNTAPDPTTTDNSATPASAIRPSIQGDIAIIQGVLNQYSPGTQIWVLENGENLPNNSPNNKNSNPSVLPSQQSRYTRDCMAQMQYAGADKYAFYTLQANDDPKELCGLAISDIVTHIAANPQWAGATAPTNLLYQSVDALSFEGTTTNAPTDQYFSIMNPTGSSQTWSIASSQSWLTAKTLPTNGMKGTTGANLTSGTLAAGQSISLKCTADSTTNGLTTLTALTGTLTVTIGGNVSTITVSLFVTPNTANPNLTSGSAGPGNGPTFNMTVNAAPPANQAVTFRNADSFATWWYAFATSNWFTINTASGNLAGGATQNITISIASIASSLAPGTYTENLTISATPFPPTYTTSDQPPPATTQFITVIVKLVVGKSSTSAVQLSTSTFNFAAVASGALPASQTFYLLNCRNATDSWTVTKTQTWLTLSPTSGSNLPANGSSTGTSPNIQHTDYAVITASINSTGLAAGTYTDTITVTLGTATATIAVSYVVSSTAQTMIIGAVPTSRTLSQVQGGTPVTATTTLTNSGNTDGVYHHTTAYTHGTGFLSMSPGSATLTASGGTQVVTFTCTPGSLVPDTYTATVTFNLGTTSATVNITFTVTASGSAAVLSASPASMSFNDVVGQALTAPQSITLSNTGALSGTWASSIAYITGNNWMVLSPTTDTLAAGANEAVTVTMNDISLAIGTYTATITFSAGSSSIQVAVTLIINASATSSSAQMTQGDMNAQYQRIMSTVVGQELNVLASVYYGNGTNNQVVYGELDALFPYETMSQLHVMKSINDVTAFLNAYAYVAKVLNDSPIVYYRLGESSGIYAYDISGRTMTGTISNTGGVIAGVTQGQAGALPSSPDTAYLFDGATGNIILPAGVNTANWSALSIEAWINPSNITFTYTAFIVANDNPTSTHIGFQLSINKNAVIFRIGKGGSTSEINQPYTFAASTWYHLVGVFAGTSLTVYVNGSQIATITIAAAIVAQTTNVVNVGSKPGVTTNNFPGTLDEIALYNTALSAARVQSHYLSRLSAALSTQYALLILSDNPVAYYHMNETSGLVARDATSNHFDAALSGSSLTYSVAGVIASDTAIGFGGNDSLIFPSTLVLANYAGYSLEYWINITSGWQHIVITVDATGNTLYYLNGASYSSGSGDSVVVDIDVYYTGSFSAGSLDEIAVYSYVLSASQVANHFQVGSLGV